MKRYFDTHCHLTGYYQNDVRVDLNVALKNHVTKVVVPGTSIEDSLEAIELAKSDTNHQVFAAAGIHPSNAFSVAELKLFDLINFDDIVAIGETGIDLYHTKTNPPLSTQRELFIYHINLALKHNKTLIVHGRNAEAEIYEIFKSMPKLPTIVMHCYTGSWEWAEKFVALGAYISMSGALTYNKTETIREVALKTPLNQLICETDAPFLAPEPYRGQYNQLDNVRLVADYLANIRKEDDDVVLEALYQNAIKAFNL